MFLTTKFPQNKKNPLKSGNFEKCWFFFWGNRAIQIFCVIFTSTKFPASCVGIPATILLFLTPLDGLRFRSLISVLGWILFINKNVNTPAEHFKNIHPNSKKRDRNLSPSKFITKLCNVLIHDSVSLFRNKRFALNEMFH